MFYYSKKAQSNQIPVLKVLVIIIILSISIIGAFLILYPINSYVIDEKKINTQIIINQALSANCFSDSYGTIDETKFTTDIINDCFKGINENTLVRISLNDKFSYYVNDKEDLFISKANLCSHTSTILCTEMHFPISILNSQNPQPQNTLKLQIITT